MQFDVAIVGLGAMGSAAAWHLARRGLRVLGIDRHHPPHHFGSSHGLTRIIREAYYESPEYVPLVRRAYALWDELSAAAGTSLIQRVGGLMIGPPDSQVVQGASASARLHRIAAASWPADAIRDHVPALAPAPDMVGLWEPGAGVVFPERAIEFMLADARQRGATLLFDTIVTGWAVDRAGVRVATAVQDYRAARLVVAAGPWISSLLPDLGVQFTVERAVQHWFTPADPAICTPDRLPVFIMEYAPGRLLYGLPDLGDGVKTALHHGGEITTADAVRRTVSEDERTAMRGLVLQWAPGAAGRLHNSTVCLYTNTVDGHFLLDRHPSHPNVLLASACSGHGFKFAPAVGEVLADLATDREPRVDISTFRLARLLRA